ncbi:MAG: PDZ domain-containing protein [Akkermansiaceae bacterium]
MKKSTSLVACCSFLILASGMLPLSAQEISFAALKGKGGAASVSSGVLVDDQGTLATVVEIGSDASSATLSLGGDDKTPHKLKLIARDADSRVALFEVPVAARAGLKKSTLGSSTELVAGGKLFASNAGADQKNTARYSSRVNRFQGKVLPLAVLRVNHGKAAPRPGTGIYNTDGNLVGLVRQAVYNAPHSSYCLPVEVISRIKQDHQRNKRVRRCWVGLIMDELVATPIIESIRPDSPADKAGLKKGDTIISIGKFSVGEYSEVVDAFFYLIAGQPTKFKVLRGTEVMTFEVSPEVKPGS